MTFTNTKSVGKNWSWCKVFSQASWQLNNQLNNQLDDQVLWKVYDQINSIRNKIHQEIDK